MRAKRVPRKSATLRGEVRTPLARATRTIHQPTDFIVEAEGIDPAGQRPTCPVPSRGYALKRREFLSFDGRSERCSPGILGLLPHRIANSIAIRIGAPSRSLLRSAGSEATDLRLAGGIQECATVGIAFA